MIESRCITLEIEFKKMSFGSNFEIRPNLELLRCGCSDYLCKNNFDGCSDYLCKNDFEILEREGSGGGPEKIDPAKATGMVLTRMVLRKFILNIL